MPKIKILDGKTALVKATDQATLAQGYANQASAAANKFVDSVATLRNTNGNTGEKALLRSYYTDTLYGGGNFYWSATDPYGNGDDGGIVFSAPSGFWVRQFDGPVNVSWFGAKGDGITLDQVAIQNAIDFVQSIGGGKVISENGLTYLLSSNGLFFDNSPCAMILDNYSNIIMDFKNSLFKMNLGQTDTTFFGIEDSSNIELKGRFQGCGAARVTFESRGVWANNVSNLRCDLEVWDNGGCGVSFSTVSNFHVTGYYHDNLSEHGVRFSEQCNNGYIDADLENNFQYGIRLTYGTHDVRGVVRIRNSGSNGVMVMWGTKDIQLSGYVHNSSAYGVFCSADGTGSGGEKWNVPIRNCTFDFDLKNNANSDVYLDKCVDITVNGTIYNSLGTYSTQTTWNSLRPTLNLSVREGKSIEVRGAVSQKVTSGCVLGGTSISLASNSQFIVGDLIEIQRTSGVTEFNIISAIGGSGQITLQNPTGDTVSVGAIVIRHKEAFRNRITGVHPIGTTAIVVNDTQLHGVDYFYPGRRVTILLDNGSRFISTITSISGTNTINIQDALTSAASSGANDIRVHEMGGPIANIREVHSNGISLMGDNGIAHLDVEGSSGNGINCGINDPALFANHWVVRGRSCYNNSRGVRVYGDRNDISVYAIDDRVAGGTQLFGIVVESGSKNFVHDCYLFPTAFGGSPFTDFSSTAVTANNQTT